MLSGTYGHSPSNPEGFPAFRVRNFWKEAATDEDKQDIVFRRIRQGKFLSRLGFFTRKPLTTKVLSTDMGINLKEATSIVESLIGSGRVCRSGEDRLYPNCDHNLKGK